MTPFEDCSFKVIRLTASPKATNCPRFEMRSLYQREPMLEVHLCTVWDIQAKYPSTITGDKSCDNVTGFMIHEHCSNLHVKRLKALKW
jgi:hypothetical protein